MKAGIYATIAVALKGAEWRRVSMVLMGKGIAEPLAEIGALPMVPASTKAPSSTSTKASSPTVEVDVKV